MSTSERQRRYWERVLGQSTDQSETAELKARIAELETELAQERSKPKPQAAGKREAPPLADNIAEWDAARTRAEAAKAAARPVTRAENKKITAPLQARIDALEAALAGNPEPRIAELEKKLAAARTQIGNLRGQLTATTRWYEEKTSRGIMPYATYISLMRALHPDTVWRSEADKAEKQTEAGKLLTAWGADAKDRAKRR